MTSRDKQLWIGGSILVAVVLVAIFAPELSRIDPGKLDPAERLAPPSAAHWFGTDMLGRDLLSRIVFGSRVSLIVGLSVALLASGAGLLIGILAGFVRPLDGIIMRAVEAVMAIPTILLAVSLAVLSGGGLRTVILAIVIADMPRVTRLVRAMTLSLRERLYIDAARIAGSTVSAILWRHILPNTLPMLVVQASYLCASAMIVESVLAFIGVGTSSITPSWGNIMADGRAYWQLMPLLVLLPAAALGVTVLAVNLIGDGLRDLLDPHMQVNG